MTSLIGNELTKFNGNGSEKQRKATGVELG